MTDSKSKQKREKMRLSKFYIFAFMILLIGVVCAQDLNITPNFQQVDNDTTFEFNITIDDVTELYSFQFDLSYDPTILSYVGYSLGPFLSSDGASVFPVAPDMSTPGLVNNFAATRMGTTAGVTGSGVLVTFIFRAIDTGTSSLTFSNTLLYDSQATPQLITHNINDGSIQVVIPITCVDGDSDGYNGYDAEDCPSGTDCNDANEFINPGMPEDCFNTVDDDCDGDIDFADSECQVNGCVDTDTDGFDNCTVIEGGDSENVVDCDNNNADIYPGAPELCDGFDNQCPTDETGTADPGDGIVDEGCAGLCIVTNASWNTTMVDEDERVSLIVDAQDCDGLTATFYIYEKDGFLDDILGGGDDPVTNPILPPVRVVASDQAVVEWIAEWQDDAFWEFTEYPEYYFLVEVNGTNYSSDSFLNPYLEVSLTQRKYIEVTIPLNPGKNSFSLPLFLDNYSIDEVFSGVTNINRIYTYDEGFKIRHFDSTPSNLDYLEVGRGYIIDMGAGDSITLNGTRRDESLQRPTINVLPGWNFVGTFSNSYEAQDILQEISYSELYTYNETTMSYEVVAADDYLEQERSYWVYVDEAGSFIPLTGIVIGKI